MKKHNKKISSNKHFVNESEKHKIDDNHFMFLKKLEPAVRKSLKQKFLFIMDVNFNPKVIDYSDGDEFIMINTDIKLNVGNLPNYDNLASFIKSYHENKFNLNVSFGNLKWFYDDNHHNIGENLTELVNAKIKSVFDFYKYIYSVNEDDFHLNYYFVMNN